MLNCNIIYYKCIMQIFRRSRGAGGFFETKYAFNRNTNNNKELLYAKQNSHKLITTYHKQRNACSSVLPVARRSMSTCACSRVPLRQPYTQFPTQGCSSFWAQSHKQIL